MVFTLFLKWNICLQPHHAYCATYLRPSTLYFASGTLKMNWINEVNKSSVKMLRKSKWMHYEYIFIGVDLIPRSLDEKENGEESVLQKRMISMIFGRYLNIWHTRTIPYKLAPEYGRFITNKQSDLAWNGVRFCVVILRSCLYAGELARFGKTYSYEQKSLPRFRSFL